MINSDSAVYKLAISFVEESGVCVGEWGGGGGDADESEGWAGAVGKSAETDRATGT